MAVKEISVTIKLDFSVVAVVVAINVLDSKSEMVVDVACDNDPAVVVVVQARS